MLMTLANEGLDNGTKVAETVVSVMSDIDDLYEVLTKLACTEGLDEYGRSMLTAVTKARSAFDAMGCI